MDEQRVVTILYNAVQDGGQAFVGTNVAIVNWSEPINAIDYTDDLSEHARSKQHNKTCIR
jgi:hypothetical protein